MPGQLVLEATVVTKRYGETTAVDLLSLSVHAGEACCLLGPNGAGRITRLNPFLVSTATTAQ